jgi:hypothetical protein
MLLDGRYKLLLPLGIVYELLLLSNGHKLSTS